MKSPFAKLSVKLRALSPETRLIGLACTFDLCLTAILLAGGYMTEANPFLRFFLNYGLWAMCLAKLASFLLPLAFAEWYRRQRPQFVTSLLRVVLTLYIAGYILGVGVVNRAFAFF